MKIPVKTIKFDGNSSENVKKSYKYFFIYFRKRVNNGSFTPKFDGIEAGYPHSEILDPAWGLSMPEQSNF